MTTPTALAERLAKTVCVMLRPEQQHFLPQELIEACTLALQEARREGKQEGVKETWEEAAKIAESKYYHRDPTQQASYRAGDFTLDHEAAGDAIASDCRRQAAQGKG